MQQMVGEGFPLLPSQGQKRVPAETVPALDPAGSGVQSNCKADGITNTVKLFRARALILEPLCVGGWFRDSHRLMQLQ